LAADAALFLFGPKAQIYADTAGSPMVAKRKAQNPS
jgi:hypothetical protein